MKKEFETKSGVLKKIRTSKFRVYFPKTHLSRQFFIDINLNKSKKFPKRKQNERSQLHYYILLLYIIKDQMSSAHSPELHFLGLLEA
jgi:hypothetical protein